ncbi:MAG TPA: PH domain-containing protein [Acidimicrobiales bacterium]|nr:PH domain-containing protein [Acidimicrobiales bacterium]
MSLAPPVGGWQRLHPLTPIVTGGRVGVVLLVVLAEDSLRGSRNLVSVVIELVLLGIVMLFGLVKWLVTRWALDGSTLRIETGLLRRDARQLPLSRIQAVDVVRPFLARAFGLAELRVRLAGSGRSNGRLAYLAEPVAIELRARLLAGHHGLDLDTPEPAERPVATVPANQLVISAVLAPTSFVAALLVAAIIALPEISRAAAAATVGFLIVYLIGFVRQIWRRVVDQYGFAVGVAPDGIRVRRGLFSTVSETIPYARVQAVRKLEPLLWRPLRWCRLEVDVAGSAGQEQGSRSGRMTKSLLPVGQLEEADQLLYSLLGLKQFPLTKPPPRAVWKAPLSYHFLASGSDGSVVAATTGRFRKVTTWVPLEKVQSVRRVQGPLQRAFNLASVKLDAAGRRVRAELRDREVEEADHLFEQFVVESRAARWRAARRARTSVGAAGNGPGGTLFVQPPAETGQPLPPPPPL